VFYLIVPETFRPGEFLRGRLLHRHDDAYYFVHLIVTKTARGQADDEGFVRLKAAHLMAVMSKDHYAAVISSLVDGGAVVRAPYRSGERSYGYRMAERYCGDPHRRVEVTDERLSDRLELYHRRREAEREARLLPVHHDLAERQRRLSIDGEIAREILESLPERSNPFDVQGIQIAAIERGDFALGVGQYGRVFNNVTAMKRELRSALRVDGQPLAHVDLRNSQPALVAYLMHRTDTRQVPFAAKSGKSKGELNEGIIYDSERKQLYRGDFHLYRDLCQRGELYDYLEGELGRRGVVLDRDQVKKRFLTDVVAKKGNYRSPVEDLVAERFPTVWQCIRQINSGGRDSHGNLIRELQRAEAKLVIEGVAADVMERHPSMFVLTLHDAIFAPPSDLSRVVDVFGETFERIQFPMGFKLVWPCGRTETRTSPSLAGSGASLATVAGLAT
jgi:hypothetical protein